MGLSRAASVKKEISHLDAVVNNLREEFLGVSVSDMIRYSAAKPKCLIFRLASFQPRKMLVQQ